MSRKYIPVEEVAKEWMKRPEFAAAYDALEDEFAMASALIKAPGDAAMTQEQVAQAMGTKVILAPQEKPQFDAKAFWAKIDALRGDDFPEVNRGDLRPELDEVPSFD